MSEPFQFDTRAGRIRSSWNSAALLRGKLLTDRKIRQYWEAGYYSAEYRTARREFAAKRAANRQAHEGNFETVQGRLIFRPK